MPQGNYNPYITTASRSRRRCLKYPKTPGAGRDETEEDAQGSGRRWRNPEEYRGGRDAGRGTQREEIRKRTSRNTNKDTALRRPRGRAIHAEAGHVPGGAWPNQVCETN
ncbi:hypothetical protein NDU88_006983 [Pleurodeles waltl]|uniref:Uncharacterized protein n=1 Tax=Pleurodeles waltl TaxID=8319 RepID=A0AAV7U058_PLEWA|nr:hypothetical protein NDU88_006983 [Pleurodeles waltl]